LGTLDAELTAAAGEADKAGGVRALDLDGDAAALDALWQMTLGTVWPMEPGRLGSIATGGSVLEGDNALDAAVLVNRSALVALMVAPHRQRRGLGTALLHSTAPASIGSGGDKYLWPGVPKNLPGAMRFFDRAGWREAYVAWDYCAQLDLYRPPALVAAPGVRYLRSSSDRHDEVVDFNRRNFPHWARHFERLPPGCAFLAVDNAERVVASLLTEWDGLGDPGAWRRLLGANLGSLGAVGVDPQMQRRGIGTALVVHATQDLQSVGVSQCHVGWLVRTSFYANAGFKPWRAYRMLERH